jgi:hypothetical protein
MFIMAWRVVQKRLKGSEAHSDRRRWRSTLRRLLLLLLRLTILRLTITRIAIGNGEPGRWCGRVTLLVAIRLRCAVVRVSLGRVTLLRRLVHRHARRRRGWSGLGSIGGLWRCRGG